MEITNHMVLPRQCCLYLNSTAPIEDAVLIDEIQYTITVINTVRGGQSVESSKWV